MENGTAGRECLFEVLCDGVSTQFGLRTLARYREKTCPTCCSIFQNLRLGGIELDRHAIIMRCRQTRGKQHLRETYPLRIGRGLNVASCMLGIMLSSLMGLPNPAWVSLSQMLFTTRITTGTHARSSRLHACSFTRLARTLFHTTTSSCYHIIM